MSQFEPGKTSVTQNYHLAAGDTVVVCPECKCITTPHPNTQSNCASFDFVCRNCYYQANVINHPENFLVQKMPFGKHQGTGMKNVPENYLRWLETRDIDPKLKFTAGYYLTKRAEAGLICPSDTDERKLQVMKEYLGTENVDGPSSDYVYVNQDSGEEYRILTPEKAISTAISMLEGDFDDYNSDDIHKIKDISIRDFVSVDKKGWAEWVVSVDGPGPSLSPEDSLEVKFQGYSIFLQS